MLKITGLSKQFGPIQAVDNVSVELRKDEITSVIGPNGAGKTTLFNLITGELTPTAGEISYQGERLDKKPQHEIAKSGIVRSYQITNVFPELTAIENVRLGVQAQRQMNPIKKYFSHYSSFETVIDDAYGVLERTGLSDVADQKAANLAHGEQRHLDICIALATEPELLLLDEPTAGMSPEETNETLDLIRELSEEATITIIEHDMNVVMDLSDRIIVMNDGEVLSDGTPETIRNDQAVQNAYLGGSV